MADLERVRVWAEALIKMHLNTGPGERPWAFGFDHAKRRAGLCNYTTRRITVSRYLAAKYDDDEVHQILLHEVAHAMAGMAAAHGPVWMRTAREIGYVGGRTHNGEIAHELAPWVGSCPAGHEHAKFRKPTRATSCGKCSRSFSHDYVIRWVKRELLAARTHS